MHRIRALSLIGLLVVCAGGCTSPEGKRPIAGNQESGPEDRAPTVRTDSGREAPGGLPARPVSYTAENNPTTNAGRGVPSLDDFLAPAAWVLIDGHEGRFVERDGRQVAMWTIELSVSDSPTFQVAVLATLVGRPTEFACTLDTIGSDDGSGIQYAIKANDGAFSVGRAYSLLRPGSEFVVRNRLTGDVVNEIAPLSSGSYLLAAKIADPASGKAALAITQFTVR
jgi:hypothetical protein